MTAAALEPDEFEAALAAVLSGRPSGLVVAVSGGPDSCALMGLVATVGLARSIPVTVATVDHGLRPTSADDAAFVRMRAAAFNLPCEVLHWDGPKPGRAIQEKARDARYALLRELCRRLGADHLVTAHTLEDQAETILFRLARGSSLAGLAGMASRTVREGLVHARPLLGLSKARLTATCATKGWPFLDDPSNRDPRFARARLRRLLPLLAEEGLDIDRIVRLGRRAARIERALVAATDHAATACRQPAQPGMEQIDGRVLAREPEEIALRVLGAAITRIGHEDAPRLDRLERLAEALLQAIAGGSTLGRTLHGTRVRLGRDGVVTITPEGPRRRGRARPL